MLAATSARAGRLLLRVTRRCFNELGQSGKPDFRSDESKVALTPRMFAAKKNLEKLISIKIEKKLPFDRMLSILSISSGDLESEAELSAAKPRGELVRLRDEPGQLRPLPALWNAPLKSTLFSPLLDDT